MVIFAKTNDNLYNMSIIQNYEKFEDNKIKFTYYTGYVNIEEYDDSDTRDGVYANIENEFTKNVD